MNGTGCDGNAAGMSVRAGEGRGTRQEGVIDTILTNGYRWSEHTPKTEYKQASNLQKTERKKMETAKRRLLPVEGHLTSPCRVNESKERGAQ